jgi:hypothetical protein
VENQSQIVIGPDGVVLAATGAPPGIVDLHLEDCNDLAPESATPAKLSSRNSAALPAASSAGQSRLRGPRDQSNSSQSRPLPYDASPPMYGNYCYRSWLSSLPRRQPLT